MDDDTENYPKNPTVPNDGYHEDDGEHGCPHQRGGGPRIRHGAAATKLMGTGIKCNIFKSSPYTEDALQVMLNSRFEDIVQCLVYSFILRLINMGFILGFPYD